MPNAAQINAEYSLCLAAYVAGTSNAPIPMDAGLGSKIVGRRYNDRERIAIMVGYGDGQADRVPSHQRQPEGVSALRSKSEMASEVARLFADLMND